MCGWHGKQGICKNDPWDSYCSGNFWQVWFSVNSQAWQSELDRSLVHPYLKLVGGPETGTLSRSLVACRITGPILGTLNQNLHFNKSPRWSVDILENTVSQLPHLMGYSHNCPSEIYYTEKMSPWEMERKKASRNFQHGSLTLGTLSGRRAEGPRNRQRGTWWPERVKRQSLNGHRLPWHPFSSSLPHRPAAADLVGACF